MHPIKKVLQNLTGYWLHKVETLPVGADFFIDIHHRLGYGSLITIFDVGANVGQTVEWLRSGEPLSKIYCFEPVSATFHELMKRKSGDKNCVFEQLAFGDKKEAVTIKVFEDTPGWNSLRPDLMNNSTSAKEEVVQVVTIDDYCRSNNIQKIDLLKIDTEGYEINVLEGAKKMLDEKKISIIYSEVGFQHVNARNTNLADLTAWLEQHNYYFFGLYQLRANAWKEGKYFGNAVYVQQEVYNFK